MQERTVDLTLELRCADGTATEFYQDDEECVSKTLNMLTMPRLLIQPQLVLSSHHGVSAVPCWGIDMILARTSAEMPLIFPLIFPAGLLDIVEVPGASRDNAPADTEDPPNGGSRRLGPLTTHARIHTLGGWVVTLKALAMARGAVHDQPEWFANIFNLPVIPFRLEEGGIGLLNPHNITRLRACPTPEALPETALPMELPRRSQSSQFRSKPVLAILSDFENEL